MKASAPVHTCVLGLSSSVDQGETNFGTWKYKTTFFLSVRGAVLQKQIALRKMKMVASVP